MKGLIREPLVHFLALGFLLFVFFDWKGGGSGPGSTHITISPGLVEHLASGFAKTWQRQPTGAELKGLIDEHVKEEIATREAIAMGLDRDDAIIRRRLRQKMEFLAEDAIDQSEPTDAELQAWLDRNGDAIRAESRVAIRQVYLSPERHGASARAEALKLLARLRSAGPALKTDTVGDPSMLPHELPLGPLSEVSRAFGSEFAAIVDALAPRQWSGPIESPYGLHLVLVTEKVVAARPALADVRPLVEREYLAERRKTQLQVLYERLLEKYRVSIEMPKDAEKQTGARPAGVM